MVSELKRRHPTRLDLPSESEVRQCVSSLVAKQKKGQSATFQTNRGIASPYLETILHIFEQDKTIAPRIAWQKFIVECPFVHPLPQWYPDEKKVKSKISSLKAAFKKQQKNNSDDSD